MRILVIGGGSWGSALAYILSSKGHTTYLWEYNKKVKEEILKYRENKTYLEGVKFNDNLIVIDDYNEYVNEVDFVLLAIPTQYIRSIISKINLTKKNQIFVNVAKGLEIGTLKRVSEIVYEELGKDVNYVLLAGPTHAEEVAKGMPSAILSVSTNENIAKIIQEAFSNDLLRVYTGTDVIGSELAGALKNCIAIAAGISDGLGYEDNTKAALMTRGLNEMMIIAKFYGAKEKTFMGLTGFGDLVVTCTSMHSRNRYLGEQIGKGKKVEDIIKEMKMIAEGASTIKALKEIIEINNLRTPIFIELYNILYNNQKVDSITEIFMNRNLKSEF